MPSASPLGAFGRELRDEDLIECLETNSGRFGAELVGYPRAIEIWRRLSRSRSFNSTVVEGAQPVKGYRILCFGCGAFVTRAFADAELSNPRPGLNSRIIASIDSGQSVVLSKSGLRASNSVGGIDMVVLYASWRCGLLDQAGVSEVCAVTVANFIEANLGYRFNRLMMETVGAEEAAIIDSMHIWRHVCRFDQPFSEPRSLWVITREDALAVNGSAANPLFHYIEPVFRLREVDQQLLAAALRGYTDEELAAKLEISLTAVKKRWLSIFESTVEARPDLFPAVAVQKDAQKRGRQKRHHVLSYMRVHPQELRPIE